MSATRRAGHYPDPKEHYFTPWWCVRAIFPYLTKAERILDPCAGNGGILQEVAKFFHKDGSLIFGIERDMSLALDCATIPNVTDVIAADALAASTKWNNPNLVIMNPPFSMAEQFIRRAAKEISSGGTVAVLLRLGFMASQKRRNFWDTHQADAFIIAKRPSFKKIGKSSNDATDYGWFLFSSRAEGRWCRLEVTTGKILMEAPEEKVILT